MYQIKHLSLRARGGVLKVASYSNVLVEGRHPENCSQIHYSWGYCRKTGFNFTNYELQVSPTLAINTFAYYSMESTCAIIDNRGEENGNMQYVLFLADAQYNHKSLQIIILLDQWRQCLSLSRRIWCTSSQAVCLHQRMNQIKRFVGDWRITHVGFCEFCT